MTWYADIGAIAGDSTAVTADGWTGVTPFVGWLADAINVTADMLSATADGLYVGMYSEYSWSADSIEVTADMTYYTADSNPLIVPVGLIAKINGIRIYHP